MFVAEQSARGLNLSESRLLGRSFRRTPMSARKNLVSHLIECGLFVGCGTVVLVLVRLGIVWPNTEDAFRLSAPAPTSTPDQIGVRGGSRTAYEWRNDVRQQVAQNNGTDIFLIIYAKRFPASYGSKWPLESVDSPILAGRSINWRACPNARRSINTYTNSIESQRSTQLMSRIVLTFSACTTSILNLRQAVADGSVATGLCRAKAPRRVPSGRQRAGFNSAGLSGISLRSLLATEKGALRCCTQRRARTRGD